MKAKIELIPEENVEETIIRCHKMTDEIQNIERITNDDDLRAI